LYAYIFEQGFNKRSLELSRLLEREEAKIVGIGDGKNALYNQDGINIE